MRTRALTTLADAASAAPCIHSFHPAGSSSCCLHRKLPPTWTPNHSPPKREDLQQLPRPQQSPLLLGRARGVCQNVHTSFRLQPCNWPISTLAMIGPCSSLPSSHTHAEATNAWSRSLKMHDAALYQADPNLPAPLRQRGLHGMLQCVKPGIPTGSYGGGRVRSTVGCWSANRPCVAAMLGGALSGLHCGLSGRRRAYDAEPAGVSQQVVSHSTASREGCSGRGWMWGPQVRATPVPRPRLHSLTPHYWHGLHVWCTHHDPLGGSVASWQQGGRGR